MQHVLQQSVFVMTVAVHGPSGWILAHLDHYKIRNWCKRPVAGVCQFQLFLLVNKDSISNHVSLFFKLVQYHITASRWQRRSNRTFLHAFIRLPVSCWQCFIITGSCSQLKYLGPHNKVAARVETFAMSLQEELVAAMQKAFQVAVQIAVEEVTKLVGRTTGTNYYEMLEENESLKQRLLRAEAMLDERGDASSHTKQHLDAINHTGRPPYRCYRQKSKDPDAGNSTGFRCGRPADQHLDLQHTRRQQKRRSGDGVKRQHDSGGASHPHRHDGCAGRDAFNVGRWFEFRFSAPL